MQLKQISPSPKDKETRSCISLSSPAPCPHLVTLPNTDFWVTFPIRPLLKTSPKFSLGPLKRNYSFPRPWQLLLGQFWGQFPRVFPLEAEQRGRQQHLMGRRGPPSPSSFSTLSSEQKLRNRSRKFLQQEQIGKHKQRAGLRSFCFSTRREMISPIHRSLGYADSLNFIAGFAVRCIYFTSQASSQS